MVCRAALNKYNHWSSCSVQHDGARSLQQAEQQQQLPVGVIYSWSPFSIQKDFDVFHDSSVQYIGQNMPGLFPVKL